MVSKNRRGRWTEAENEKQAALKAMCSEGEFDEVASELRLKEAPTNLGNVPQTTTFMNLRPRTSSPFPK